MFSKKFFFVGEISDKFLLFFNSIQKLRPSSVSPSFSSLETKNKNNKNTWKTSRLSVKSRVCMFVNAIYITYTEQNVLQNSMEYYLNNCSLFLTENLGTKEYHSSEITTVIQYNNSYSAYILIYMTQHHIVNY